jgi:hypothetical protein
MTAVEERQESEQPQQRGVVLSDELVERLRHLLFPTHRPGSKFAHWSTKQDPEND